MALGLSSVAEALVRGCWSDPKDVRALLSGGEPSGHWQCPPPQPGYASDLECLLSLPSSSLYNSVRPLKDTRFKEDLGVVQLIYEKAWGKISKDK